MIKAIVGKGTLLNPNGKPAAKLVVNLQWLTLKGTWNTIAQSRATLTGSFNLRMTGNGLEELRVIPHLRLAGGRGEVLAENPVIEASRNEMLVDFGRTVRGGKSNALTDRLAKAERDSHSLMAEKNILAQRKIGRAHV